MRLLQQVTLLRTTLRQNALRAVFLTMERLLAVDPDLWCFCTWTDYHHTLDNPRAVFEQVKNDPAIRKVVLYRNARRHAEHDGRNVEFVRALSLRGLWLLARSGVIVLGFRISSLGPHGTLLTSKHVIVQVWHGIPLKRIGRLFPGEDGWAAETARYAATVCSSDADRDIMQQAFAPLTRDRVWLTGLPRNDFITGEQDALPADYRAVLDRLRKQLAGRRFVLYAPTWRDAQEDLYAFSQEELAQLEQLLRAHGAVLGVRGHSNVRSADAYERDFGSDAFLNMNDVPDANLLLRVADVLVTDYSSIYIDYLLTDRPVIHFVYDLEQYVATRGLLYSTDEAFAGPTAKTFADLTTQLERALTDPRLDIHRRQRARALFHSHDGPSGGAVADNIRKLVNDRFARAAPRQGTIPAAPPARTAVTATAAQRTRNT